MARRDWPLFLGWQGTLGYRFHRVERLSCGDKKGVEILASKTDVRRVFGCGDEAEFVPDEVRMKDETTAVFYRPIMIQGVCLKCHGDPGTFSAELLEKLAKLYPDDMATGYTTGRLRGAFRVEFPPEAD